MWCPRCHTEVAAEIAQNGQSLLCTSCGTEIQRVYAPSLHPDTRSARELLERWSKADLHDVAPSTPSTASEEVPTAASPDVSPLERAPFAASSEAPSPQAAAQSAQPVDRDEASATDETTNDSSIRRDRPERAKPDRPTPKPRTVWRVDAAHAVPQPVSPPPPIPPRRPHFSAVIEEEAVKPSLLDPVPQEVKLATATRPAEPLPTPEPAEAERPESPRMADAPEPPPARPATPWPAASANVLHRRLDPAHESLGGPHFEMQAFLAQDSRQPGKSESIWGQVLAYAGVGLITVGTTLVLWGWFGQVPQYAPTGWLICTVGQMLLFLGVITLISGGMQQTSHEVTRRVEYLGDRILRFEQSADHLFRGPHFNESRDRGRMKFGQAAQADGDTVDA